MNYVIAECGTLITASEIDALHTKGLCETTIVFDGSRKCLFASPRKALVEAIKIMEDGDYLVSWEGRAQITTEKGARWVQERKPEAMAVA